MIEFFYSSFMWLLKPFMLMSLKKRAKKEPGYGEFTLERLGTYKNIPLNFKNAVWIHSVSLGETHAVAPFITELRKLMPDMQILLTHSTATGRQSGKSLLQNGDHQVWLPWDSKSAVTRFLTTFRPCIGLLMETEVWPLLILQCKKMSIPLCLINARMSKKTLEASHRLGLLAKKIYPNLSAIWAQSSADAENLRSLGGPICGIYGNFKFDAHPNQKKLVQGQTLKRLLTYPVITLASSREGEELMFIHAIKKSIKSHPTPIQWMIVPRHPNRFQEIGVLCRKQGFSVSYKSDWSNETSPPRADIWIGNTMGEMPFYYALSDVALLGGSFAPFGGQNLIEAALCSCPVIMGPSTYNFASASQLAKACSSAASVSTMSEAVSLSMHWISHSSELQQYKKNTQNLVSSNQGASRKTALAVTALLKQTTSTA